MTNEAASIRNCEVVNGTDAFAVQDTGMPLAAVTVHCSGLGNIPATDRSVVLAIPMVAWDVFAAPITVIRRVFAVQSCGTGTPAASVSSGPK